MIDFFHLAVVRRRDGTRVCAPSSALLMAAALAIGGVPHAGAQNEFDFDTVVDRARDLAARPHHDETLEFTGDFAELDYDQYRDIRFRVGTPVWQGDDSPFEIDLLPPGFFYDRPVEINVVENGAVRTVPYANDWFEFGPLVEPPGNPAELGFSGFRLRTPINRPDVLDEFVVFQGASYFRAVAREQLYGLSARALAIDTATGRGEEFPRFTRFWIEVPTSESAGVVVHALLDSPSISGAYRFEITPGRETRMDIESVLFARRDVEVPGIAPLTSMFLYDDVNRERFDDYRDAVHDSNGLQIVNGSNERLWRSLANHATLQVSDFVDENPVGFGLVQRKRGFGDYEDAEAHYERRPSAWVHPLGDWGEGSVRLVEIPTDSEHDDNVVAFWKPADGFESGGEYRYAYRLTWTDRPPDEVPLMRVRDVRAGERVSIDRPGTFEIVIDFTIPPGRRDDGPIEPRVQASAGRIENVGGRFLDGLDRYRMHFDYTPGEKPLSEWRVQLVDEDGTPASEIWLHRWSAG